MHTRISTALFASAHQHRSQLLRYEQLEWTDLEGMQFRRVAASVIVPCLCTCCVLKRHGEGGSTKMEESVVEYSTAEPDKLWLWVLVLLRSAGDVKCVRIQTERAIRDADQGACLSALSI